MRCLRERMCSRVLPYSTAEDAHTHTVTPHARACMYVFSTCFGARDNRFDFREGRVMEIIRLCWFCSALVLDVDYIDY